MGWSCPKLPHVALSLECGGLICSGWEVERRMAPWALDVARRGVSLPPRVGFCPLCSFPASLSAPLITLPSFLPTLVVGYIFAAVFDFLLSIL